MNEDIALPCAQALLAGTLALMSAYAAPLCGAAPSGEDSRQLMARKIVANLCFLREHPGLAPPMRQVVTQLHVHWCALAGANTAAASNVKAAGAAAPSHAGPAGRLH